MNEYNPPPELRAEIAKRRTFAIISHPDAGKTTLTEKLLLYSGMIRTAGMVRARKSGKFAASDWMGMEQERGISITASAMQFNYKERVINVLDTPGHQDFSEDTYRTLTAADSAVMVLDAAKGVETQTRKLFAVCALRGIPVLTFINKMDLEGRDPLDLMQEVEEVLGIRSSAMNWPVGMGKRFVGVVDRSDKMLQLFERAAPGGALQAHMTRLNLSSPEAQERIGREDLEKLNRELELLEVAGNPFSREAFLNGRVTPVYFGSALTNFGVEPFFDAFVDLAPGPTSRGADFDGGGEDYIDPMKEPFSAYVFKLQANMDPRHRDSMAFMRVVSGRFERDMMVWHHRLGREVRMNRPHVMVAQDRSILAAAYPGDIVGVINQGMFAIGDTLSAKGGFTFKPLPQFQPEVFAMVRPKDVGKRKQYDKGLEQLTAEGTVQLLRRLDGNDTYVAAVGRLQFDVLQYRLKDEYGVEVEVTPLSFTCSAWLEGDPETFKKPLQSILVRDARDRAMVLFKSPWEKNYAAQQNPEHRLVDMAS
jgi:peptide chain release factor 3